MYHLSALHDRSASAVIGRALNDRSTMHFRDIKEASYVYARRCEDMRPTHGSTYRIDVVRFGQVFLQWSPRPASGIRWSETHPPKLDTDWLEGRDGRRASYCPMRFELLAPEGCGQSGRHVKRLSLKTKKGARFPGASGSVESSDPQKVGMDLDQRSNRILSVSQGLLLSHCCWGLAKYC